MTIVPAKVVRSTKAKNPKLTQKQEAFCLAYIETGNASEAYRRAYDVSNSKPETINRAAKQVMDNNKIAARIAELRRPAIRKVQVSLEKHLRDLEELKQLAKRDGKYGPAVQAEMARGKVSGHYVEKHEHKITVEQIDAMLAELGQQLEAVDIEFEDITNDEEEDD